MKGLARALSRMIDSTGLSRRSVVMDSLSDALMAWGLGYTRDVNGALHNPDCGPECPAWDEVPECEYDADNPCTSCYPFRHAADDCPTSEPCPGLDTCPDCQDVLAQVAESVGEGEYTTAGTRTSHHDLVVAKDGTFTTLQEDAPACDRCLRLRDRGIAQFCGPYGNGCAAGDL